MLLSKLDQKRELVAFVQIRRLERGSRAVLLSKTSLPLPRRFSQCIASVLNTSSVN